MALTIVRLSCSEYDAMFPLDALTMRLCAREQATRIWELAVYHVQMRDNRRVDRKW